MKFSFGKDKLKKIIDNSVLKKKDSLIGLPVLFTLTGFSNVRNSYKPEVINKIAVLKATSVRDIIFTANAINSLKAQYPNAGITYFAGEDNFNMASNLDGVSNAVRLFTNDLTKSMKIVKNAGYFDLWIDFGAWSRFEAIMTHTAKASYKVGFKTDGEYRHFAYDKIAEYSFDKHYAKNVDFLISTLDIKVTPINFPTRDNKIVEQLVVIDIFADNQAQSNRKWSQQNWKIIVEHISKLGYRVALIGSKKDIEEAEVFNELLGSGIDFDFLVGRLDFTDTVKLLKKAALLISGDTASLHTASYYGVPVIGLYGPTDKEKYGPLNENAVVISSYGCSSCQILYGDEKCSMTHADCMDSIPFQTVINSIDNVLGVDVEKK